MRSPFKVLIIGFVWPEWRSSAAGFRDQNLVDLFLGQGWDLTYVSGALPNTYSQDLEKRGVQTAQFVANDPRFDAFVAELKPDFVIFDRFVIEEQFGWRVQQFSPDSVRILDTIDLHFLRRTRQRGLEAGASLDDLATLRFDLHSAATWRELASILRCDMTLVISDFEADLLNNQFRISSSLIETYRLCYPNPPPRPGFDERRHLAWIGNFRHAPNGDACEWMAGGLWQTVRERLPSDTELHLYGAYPPREVMAWNKQRSTKHERLKVMGPVEDHIGALERYRVLFAPLRFGAGIKGKISDAWFAGLPVVTTMMGAEGMGYCPEWGGLVGTDESELSQAVGRLYTDKDLWQACADRGKEILEDFFSIQKNGKSLIARMQKTQIERVTMRRENFLGEMLWHHSLASTRYFGRWLELKGR